MTITLANAVAVTQIKATAQDMATAQAMVVATVSGMAMFILCTVVQARSTPASCLLLA